MENSKLLPLGVQDFCNLREGNYIYADKSALVYELTHSNRAVFLSRPRRFGKSLLLSTIKYYFLGRKDLFAGLAIEKLESKEQWGEHPVFYFSLASGTYSEKIGLKDKIKNALATIEKEYELPVQNPETTLSVRFENDLRAAYEKTGRKVVVLVDEYDKPLLETMSVNEEQEKLNRIIYKEYWSTLKDCDEYLQFYMFTGVTKFSKVSIFSDLNQLNDISLNEQFDSICGITQTELELNFATEIENLAKRYGMSKEKCLVELKKRYDGYHFTSKLENLYNPFSLLSAFSNNKFGNYWFETGTPTFLVNRLCEINFDVRKFDDNVKISESEIKDYHPESDNPVPLLYQSGYLTIKSWNQRQESYKLGFPNEEVKYAFLNALAPGYLKIEKNTSQFNIDVLDDAVEEGDTDGMRDWFTSIFALLPYPTGSDTDSVTEQNFQNVIFLTLTMMGKYARTEVHSAKGRADCVLETDDYVYIFEFKRDVPAIEALKQIDEQGYAAPYSADSRKLFKIGVNFSTSERNISEWVVR